MNPVGKPGKTGALMAVEDALEQLLAMAEAAPIREPETLALAECDGRVPVSYTHLTLPTILRV